MRKEGWKEGREIGKKKDQINEKEGRKCDEKEKEHGRNEGLSHSVYYLVLVFFVLVLMNTANYIT